MLAKDVELIIDLEEPDEVEDAIRFCTCLLRGMSSIVDLERHEVALKKAEDG